MYYYIYKITNLKNNKFYIGSHKTSNLDDGYFGSGIYLRRAITKYGKGNFSKHIILFCESEDQMRQKETELLQIYKSDESYNLKFCSCGGNTREKYTNKQKKTYIQKLINNPKSPIGKRGVLAFNYNKHLSLKTRQKQSETHKNRFIKLKSDNIKWKKWRSVMIPIAIEKCKHMTEIRSKKVKATNKVSGEVIPFKSKTECARYFNTSTCTITRHIDGRISRDKRSIHLNDYIFAFS